MDDAMKDELARRGNIPLDLPGWDRASVWFWSPMDGELVAQLWKNEDSSRDEPRFWLWSVTGLPAGDSLVALAGNIARVTGCRVAEAAAAVAACAPASVKDALAALAAA